MQTVGQSIEQRGASAPPSLLVGLGFLDKVPLILGFGVLLGFSSSGFGLWWLSWFALTPAIVLTRGCRGKLEAAVTGLLFGLAYYLVSLRWLLELYPLNWFGLFDWLGFAAAFQAWFLESFHQALLFSGFSLFVFVLPMRAGYLPFYKRPYFPFLLAVPLIWIFLQWSIAPCQLFLGVPVVQLAYSLSHVPQLIQIAKFGGAVCLDFLIVLSNCAIACLIMEFTHLTPDLTARVDPLSPRVGAVLDLVIVVICVAWMAMWGQEQVNAAVVMPPYWQWDEVVSPALPAATASLSGQKTAVVDSGGASNIEPPKGKEPVPPGPPQTTGQQRAAPLALSPSMLSPAARAKWAPQIPVAVVQGNLSVEERLAGLSPVAVADRYTALARELGVGLVVLPEGVLGMETAFKGPERLRPALEQMAWREKKEVIAGSIESLAGGRVDAVRLISPSPSAEGNLYVKNRLVPFAEFIPLGLMGSLIPSDLKGKLAGGGKGFVASPAPLLINSIFGKIGATISCELVYPDLAAGEVSKGASLLVNVADLGYFHNSILNQQLLSAAIFRAVENGRYVVIAANNGISAVIDPCGLVTSASVSGQRGILLDRVQFLHKKTPFTKMWWLWTPVVR